MSNHLCSLCHIINDNCMICTRCNSAYYCNLKCLSADYMYHARFCSSINEDPLIHEEYLVTKYNNGSQDVNNREHEMYYKRHVEKLAYYVLTHIINRYDDNEARCYKINITSDKLFYLINILRMEGIKGFTDRFFDSIYDGTYEQLPYTKDIIKDMSVVGLIIVVCKDNEMINPLYHSVRYTMRL